MKLALHDHGWLRLYAYEEHLRLFSFGHIFFEEDYHPHKYHIFSAKDPLVKAMGILEDKLSKIMDPARAISPDYQKILGADFNHQMRLKRHGNRAEARSWPYWHTVLWAPSDLGLATLLYQSQGTIYFEIIPHYRGRRRLIPYSVFMRNYRPYIRRVVSEEQIHMLKRQASGIVRTMMQ